jgi:hypothetical protein
VAEVAIELVIGVLADAAGVEHHDVGIFEHLGALHTIGAELGISSHTVKFHIASIMQKLDAASRTEAVTLAIRKGLVVL